MSSTEVNPSNALIARKSQQSTHIVQFHANDKFLIDDISHMIGSALVSGDVAVVIAAASRREQLENQLETSGFDTELARSEGRYMVLDAEATLAEIYRNRKIDTQRFTTLVSKGIVNAAANGRAEHPRVVVFGELVALLAAKGDFEAAIRLEQLWNELARKHSFSLRCAYPMDEFAGSKHTEAFLRICAEHSGVLVGQDEPRREKMNAGRERVLDSVQDLAETARIQKESFRLLTDAVEDHAVLTLDVEGCVTTWNKGAETITGLTHAQVMGKHFARFYPPEELRLGKPQRELQSAERDGVFEDESWRIREDGTRFWAKMTLLPLRDREGPLRGYGVILRDLTDKKRAEIALQNSEQRFRLLVETVQDYAIFMLDPEGRVTSWNSGAERIKGYAASEIIGQHFSRFYPADDLRAGKPEMELAVAAEQGRIEDEGWRLRKDGSKFWANVTITAVHDHSGKLIGFAKVTRDVTERMRAAQQLRESEERYRTVAETATDAIVGIDDRSRIQFVNPATSHIFGFQASELIGQPLTVLMSERLRDHHLQGLRQYMRSGIRRLNWSAAELIGRRKHGEEFPVEVSFGEVTSGEKHFFIGFIRDITKRKQAERRLSDSEKSLRELSLHLLRTQDEERRRLGRELHDSLGQYLAAVKMRLDSISMNLGSHEPSVRKQLTECSQLTEESIKEVRTISYLMYPPMLEEMGLKSAISWYVDGFTQRSGIRTSLDMSSEFERLPRDAELAMFRVLQESLTNVHRHSGSSEARIRLFVNNGMASLEIQDRGKGLPPGVLEHGSHGSIGHFGVGLRGMSERLQHLGGRLEILSTDSGTTVVATVPGTQVPK